jgi:hypothetical protein
MFLLNSNVELRTILQPGLLKLLHQDKIASTLEQFSLCTIPCTKKKSLEQYRKQNSDPQHYWRQPGKLDTGCGQGVLN